ncbi:MAG: hypothetical protein JSV89_01520 [Spirochaetaceae bacterium]|nr:MAG: hypothetical protein JSV89_01520 [Spirochaetaceae bacterium]
MENDDDWKTLFNFDDYYIDVDVNFGIYPPFKETIVEDEGDTFVVRDIHGVTMRKKKETASMPLFLEHPVKDRETWEEHKWRFDPDYPGRFPENWNKIAKDLKNSNTVVRVGTYPYGFFGGVRTLMGAEAALIACALDPELIDDINSHFYGLWEKLWSRVFEETRVDDLFIWEDMAGKQGSLISPKMFRRFLTPYYRKLHDLGQKHGVRIFSVDSDGLMHELTGLFVEAGVNVLLPYEVQAGNNIPYLLSKHPNLYAFGGIDKRAIAKGKRAIDLEMKRVKSMTALGRYLPFPDHSIPSDVSWENYQYFVWRWKELIGKKD